MLGNILLVLVIVTSLLVKVAPQVYKCYKRPSSTYVPRFQNGEIIDKIAYFEEVRSYYGSIRNEELHKEIDDTLESAQRVLREGLSLEEGISSLINKKQAYRPYRSSNDYLHDIRDTLREFTVNDIVQTFYILKS